MKIAIIIIRTLAGLFLIFAGASYLFKLMPMPAPQGAAKTYQEGLAVVNLMFYVKVIELLAGLSFVTGRFVTLMAMVMLPIIVNILLFHIIVAPAQIGGGLFVTVADFFLLYYYRNNYRSLFAAK